MISRKKLVALTIVGSLGFAGPTLAEKNGSNAIKTADKKESVSFCYLLPWSCVTTNSNGGGNEPVKPKSDVAK